MPLTEITRLPRKENAKCLIYDSNEDVFAYRGLPPVETVSPSLIKYGNALARKLIRKWDNGKFDEPLVEIL